MMDMLRHSGTLDGSNLEVLFASLQVILDSFKEMIFVKDINLVYVAGTQSFAEMVGKKSMAEIIGHTDEEILNNKELSKRYTTDDIRLLESGKDLVDYVEPLTDENGEARYSMTSKYILKDAEGKTIGLLGVSKDITNDFRAEHQHQKDIEYLFKLSKDMYCAIYMDVTDWRVIGQRRKKGQKVFPLYNSMEHLVDVMRSGVIDPGGKAEKFYNNFSQEYLLNMKKQGKRDTRLEYQFRSADGKIRWIVEELRLIRNPKSGHIEMMGLRRDIGTKKREEEKLLRAAEIDEMTGLLNRASATRMIEAFLAGEGSDGEHAAFMIDVDNFKAVNDIYGHREGDALLIKLAKHIKDCFRESDIVSRIGGDEFFVLAKNMQRVEAIKSRIEQLLLAVHELHAARTATLASFSIGVSIYPKDGKTMDELYAKADEALYKAKNLGKNRAAFASEEETVWKSNASAMRYEAYNSKVVEHSNSVCYISDLENYDLLHVTKNGMDLFGMTKPEDYLGRKCYEALMGYDSPCAFCPNNMLRAEKEYRWEYYSEKRNCWFDRSTSIIELDGRLCHLDIGRDITARKDEMALISGKLSMEDVLFRCLHTLTTVKDMSTAVNLFLEAVGGYYQANRAYLIEFDLEAKLLDNTFEWCREGVSAEIDRLQRLPLEMVSEWVEKFESDGEFSINSLCRDLDSASDDYRILEAQGIQSLMAAPLYQDGTIIGFIGVDDPRQNQGDLTLLRSVSEFVKAELDRRRLMQKLEYMSYTDSLTGLKNRNQYTHMLKAYELQPPESLGVVYVDINGIKNINDSYGHSYGDYVIKLTGEIIKRSVKGSVFRTGGDEFVALCENISRDQFENDVVELRKIFERTGECNVSIGCVWREHEENIQSLLVQAGELLTAEKQAYYHTVLQQGKRSDLGSYFSKEVIREIEEGRFTVYYQPQIELKSGRITGAEALVRKMDDDGAVVPPMKFIPFYEMEGVISYVDLYVMKTACQTLRGILDRGHELNLSVNFSRLTLLEPNIVEIISQICSDCGVPTRLITLEVTESISKMDHKQLKELIKTITDAGFSVSLDDFGTQYSYLALLSDMVFNEIKFDRSLVMELEHNQRGRVVMENCLKMCRDLKGIRTLAEGIENKTQLGLLRDYQCDYGQGYHFARPMPEQEFCMLLENSRGFLSKEKME